MTLDIQKRRTHTDRDRMSRLLWLVVVLCLFAVAWLIYDGRAVKLQSSQEGIVYTVDQSFTPTVIYHDTSLFEESRGTQTAYVRELTKDISAVGRISLIAGMKIVKSSRRSRCTYGEPKR